MMVRHPVPDELLLNYAVGSMGSGKALLVATHLAMCPSSERRYAMLQEVSGALLNSLHGTRLDQISAHGVLAQAEGGAGRAQEAPAHKPHGAVAADVPRLGGKLREIHLPTPLAGVAKEIEDPRAWRRLGLGVEAAVLTSVSTRHGKTQLLHARPGVQIVRHSHVGEELVLILQGAYWDAGERFGPGDVAVNDRDSTHAPTIDDAEDCWCLAVSEGPIRFVGPYGWLLNLFNRF